MDVSKIRVARLLQVRHQWKEITDDQQIAQLPKIRADQEKIGIGMDGSAAPAPASSSRRGGRRGKPARGGKKKYKTLRDQPWGTQCGDVIAVLDADDDPERTDDWLRMEDYSSAIKTMRKREERALNKRTATWQGGSGGGNQPRPREQNLNLGYDSDEFDFEGAQAEGDEDDGGDHEREGEADADAEGDAEDQHGGVA